MVLFPTEYRFAFKRTLLLLLALTFTLACTNDTTEDEDDLDVLNPIENSDDSGDSEDQSDSDDSENDGTENDDSGNDDSSNDEGSNDDSGNEGDSSSCTDKSSFIFVENDGLIKAEFENANFPGNWDLKSNGNSYSGEGYMSWTGAEFFNNPGTGKTTFKIRINNPGTYQFLWNSAVTIGNNGTEHNDTWLRFPDADDFFAEKGSSRVYPKGSGKSPHPEGSSGDGWFKIYRSGNDLDFKWQAFTYDNNAHKVFVTFNSPGVYKMEVSARSKGHAIDQFVLFKAPYTEADAISESADFSNIQCN